MIQSVAAVPPESNGLAAKVEPASSGSAAVTVYADGSAAAPAGAGAAAASPATAQQAGLHTNPVSVIDTALGLVVLQFYNQAGVETQSIPTKRQLAEYAQRAGIAPTES